MASLLDVQSYLGDCGPYFAVFGVVSAAWISLKTVCGICRFFRDHVVGPALGFSANVKKAGSWAAITGCTDGIGKAYALQLAEKGLNVVLLSRTQSKLDDLAQEIESKYKVQTKVIAVDFTRTDIYDRIAKEMEGLEIGTLVNNVGMGIEYPMYFLEMPDLNQITSNMLNCNVLSMVKMTSIVLPSMVERRRGYIITVGSGAAEFPFPLISLYSATKVFMDYFTKGLQMEYRSKGITFQSLQPHVVATKMSGIKQGNAAAPYPDQYVRSALRTLGITNSTNGYWFHTIQSFIMTFMPPSLLFKVLAIAREDALKKKEKEKTQ